MHIIPVREVKLKSAGMNSIMHIFLWANAEVQPEPYVPLVTSTSPFTSVE